MTEIFTSSLKLGLIAFGGPTAHLGYFREEYVRKRRWLSDEEYSDLVALSQFLPGPGSSQTIFALGLRRGGWLGGLLASAGFTTPSALLMILFAYGLNLLGDISQAGWLQGLKLAAVAVVAKAVIEMARQLCPDAPRIGLAITAAGLLVAMPNAWLQVGIIASGALVGWRLKLQTREACEPQAPAPGGHRKATLLLAAFAALLVGLPVLNSLTHAHDLALFDSFYRAGSVVFGGGHVVLPLLQSEVVPPGWVGNDAFLAGYGAAQAIPGPLFTFSAYLGTLARPGEFAWLGGLLCLIAIFLPGWLLMAGALPFWDRLRGKPAAQSALRGANAAVVGLLAAALYHPVITSSIFDLKDAIHATAAFALLKWGKCPPWLLVVLSAGVAWWV